MKKTSRGIIFILIASLGLSTESIFAKLCYNSGLNVMTVVFLRYSISAVLMLLFLFLIRERIYVKSGCVKLLSINIGIYIVFTFILFLAFDLLSPGLAIMFLYTFVAFTAILERVINKVKLTGSKIITICLSMGGIAALSGASFNSVNRWGIIFGIASAVGYAFYFISMEKVMAEGLGEPVYLFNLFAFSSVIFAAYGFFSGDISFDFSSSGWIYVGLLCLFSTCAALLALSYGVPLLGPTRSAIISTVEPPLTVLWAFIVFGDVLSPLQLFGAALVIGSILWNAVSAGRANSKVISM